MKRAPSRFITKNKSQKVFVDFTNKLSAKWKLRTLSMRPSQPKSVGDWRLDLEQIFRYLIAVPTTTGNYTANRDALDYIERFLSKYGMHTTRLEWNGIESLVATTTPTKTPKVMLAAHLDVVPGAPELFELREQDGKYLGRGVLDMKFAIATYMQLVRELRHDLGSYDFGIMITTDEEAGGLDGTQNLVEAGYIPKVCVLPDGGDNWQIQTHSKGMMSLTIAITGKPAHGSRPWLGKNAILQLTELLNELQEHFPYQKIDSNTLNVGKIQGGEAVNQVPEYAEASLDIRVMNEAEKARVLALIQSTCAAFGAELTIVNNGISTSFDLKSPYIAPFAKLVTEVTGTQVTGFSTPGSSDARYFMSHNVPCISVYPPGGGHHGREEWISKEGFYQFKEIVQKICRASRPPIVRERWTSTLDSTRGVLVQYQGLPKTVAVEKLKNATEVTNFFVVNSDVFASVETFLFGKSQ